MTSSSRGSIDAISSSLTTAQVPAFQSTAETSGAHQDRGFGAHHNSRYDPTGAVYGSLEYLIAFLNQRLFDGLLPKVVVTLTHDERVLGYFCKDAFGDAGGTITHELAINPNYLAFRPAADTYSTVAHELAHLFREQFGPPNQKGSKGSAGYHDVPWSQVMMAIGLQPTHNGKPDGKRTGYAMDHLIVEGGPFDLACRDLIASGFEIDWFGRRYALGGTGDSAEGTAGPGTLRDNAKPSKTAGKRSKFVCPSCQLAAWAKPSAQLRCGVCNATMHLSRPEPRTPSSAARWEAEQ